MALEEMLSFPYVSAKLHELFSLLFQNEAQGCHLSTTTQLTGEARLLPLSAQAIIYRLPSASSTTPQALRSPPPAQSLGQQTQQQPRS